MLKFLLDSLDGLDENVAKLYSKNSDGKFQLQVDGVPQQEDTKGLKSALQKERENVAKLEGDLKAWKKLGEKPETVSETIEGLKKAKGDPNESERLLEQATAKHKEEMAKIISERDAALSSEHSAIIENQFTAALAKAGFTDTGLQMIPQLHASRVKISDRDGQRSIDIMTEDGKAPLVGSGENSRATFDDLAKEFSIKYPDLVHSDRKGGGGTPPGGGGSGTEKQMSRSDWNNLAPDQQSKVISDGVQLVD
jgi:hypothetical protein